jgi:hypothetical protein
MTPRREKRDKPEQIVAELRDADAMMNARGVHGGSATVLWRSARRPRPSRGRSTVP